MFIGLVAGWVYLLRPRLTMRQMLYRYWYLRSRHWKETARAKRKQVGWRCQRCGERKRLDVHHKTYIRLGREKLNDLEALCRECHRKEHKQ